MSWVSAENATSLTDLYELTMAGSYHAHGMNGPATFDLFVRELPEQRNFLVACGLEQALEFLESFHFDEESVSYLRSLGIFSEEFLAFLGELRFSGDVWAMREGEIAFAGEPLLSVRAPLIEAQIAETFLLNCMSYQTLVASKAARVSLACRDRTFVDFSPRRDHGADAAIKAARASFVGGAVATSNVLAARLYGIPPTGTMAHSYVLAFENESEAFRAFARDFPDRTVLLIDTFDTEEGARRAAGVAHELAGEGIEIKGVRLDSGDLERLARSVRKILDDAGLSEARIFLSGDLDEYRIDELVRDQVPADSFGVGTRLGTSADLPYLGTVYKLVGDEHGPKMKLSTGKATLPGRKQVYRFSEGEIASHDVIALEHEHIDRARPLLEKVMEEGRRRVEAESLEALQARCRDGLSRLPDELLALRKAEGYRVEPSQELKALVDTMRGEGR